VETKQNENQKLCHKYHALTFIYIMQCVYTVIKSSQYIIVLLRTVQTKLY